MATRLQSEGRKSFRIVEQKKKKPKRKERAFSLFVKESTDSFRQKPVTSEDLKDLNTCVPFHVASDGVLVNDEVDDDCPLPGFEDGDDTDDDDHPRRLQVKESVASARAPSGHVLSLLSAARDAGPWRNGDIQEVDLSQPLIHEHDLTLPEIQVGLGGMERSGNGYLFNYTTLNLSNRGLVDVSLLEYFSQLKHLDISGNYIQCVQMLGGMPYLTTVNASRNELENFGDFRAPVALQKINFSRNRITNLVNLEKFWSLTDVNLSHNELTVVNGFEKCKHLRVLDLSHNKISTIENLQCPNLVVLLLHTNEITEIMNLNGCPNLRALSLAQNKIKNLAPLHDLCQLTELWLQNNEISDLSELGHVKSLFHLYSLCMEPNPICSLGLWQRMLIFMIPQLRYLDGKVIGAEEGVKAKNTFDPSYWKIAHETRISILLDRACQAGNTIMDNNIHKQIIPSIILLVGAPLNRCNKLAMLLKDKYRSKIQLGGVHSTATTLEFHNTNKDIPVSYETYLQMKHRGEFLATSHILGRACGFTTAQITRASERNAVLVACVPLVVAITLKKWKLRPRIVLVMPTDDVEIPHGGWMSKVESHNLLNKDDFEEAATLLASNAAEGKTGGDERIYSLTGSTNDEGHERISRHSVPAVSFVPGKTTYDFDYRGKKRPSMLPFEGHGLLKNKDDVDNFDSIPDALRKSSVKSHRSDSKNVSRRSSRSQKSDKTISQIEFLDEKQQQQQQQDESQPPQPQLEPLTPIMQNPVQDLNNNTVSTSETIEEEQNQNQESSSPFSQVQENGQLDLDNYGRNMETAGSDTGTGKSGMNTAQNEEKRRPTLSSADSFTSEFIHFLTDQENQNHSPFPISRGMSRLRRIASMFLEVGGDNLTDILMELPSLPFQPHLINSMDWKKTLMDLQMDELSTNEQAYYMTFKKLEPEGNQYKDWLRQKDICGSMAQPSMARNARNCSVSLSKEGAYQCVFIKNEGKGEEQDCSSVQGSITVDSRAISPYSANSGDRSKTANTNESESNKLENPIKMGTSRENRENRHICRKVFNPDFAFGPRDSCCKDKDETRNNNNNLNRFLSKRQSGGGGGEYPSLNEQNPCCPVPDLDRGTFFDGKFRSDFLNSQPSSDILINVEIDTSLEQDQDSSAREKLFGESEDGLQNVQIDPSDIQQQQQPLSCTVKRYSHSTDKNSDLLQDYETDEDEDEDGARRYSTAPPPSRDSTNSQYKSGEDDENNDEEIVNPVNEEETVAEAEAEAERQLEFAQEDEQNMDSVTVAGDESEPGDDTESLVSGKDENPDESGSDVSGTSTNRRRRHVVTKAAIQYCRDQYTKFHRDNPGFFNMVIDSAVINKCLHELTLLLEECIQSQKMARNYGPDGGKRPISYSHKNVLDSPQFLNHRLTEYKRISREFSKGNSCIQNLNRGGGGAAGWNNNNNNNCSTNNFNINFSGNTHTNSNVNNCRGIQVCTTPLYFQETKCPSNLLEPFITKRPKSTKLKKFTQY